MRAAWTVAMDDALCQRWRRCIFCSEAADRVELRSLASGYALTFGLCTRCLNADATAQRRQALVEQHAQRARQGAGEP